VSDQANFDPYFTLQITATAEPEVVQAAFRALARKHHPDRDQTRTASAQMARLNRAYSLLRDPKAREAFDRARRATVAGASVNTNITNPPPARSSGGSVLQFGRYSGWALRDLARKDLDYLLWLSRHSSGIRYRQEIYGILREMGVEGPSVVGKAL